MQLPVDYDVPHNGLKYLEYYSGHNVYHCGWDLNKGSGQDDCGNGVYAPRDGEVIFVNKVASNGHGFGKFIILKHFDGNYSRYAHLKDTAVEKGDVVNKTQLIGHVGNTGTTYCHLHFEVFTEDLANIQRNNIYPWCYYPSGKSKQWVREHYLDGLEWIKTPQEKTDLEKGYEYLTSNKLVKNSLPKDPLEIDQLGVILQRYEEYLVKKYNLK